LLDLNTFKGYFGSLFFPEKLVNSIGIKDASSPCSGEDNPNDKGIIG